MADKYYRLVCFVVNICPEPLRQFFIKLANQDKGPSYTTVGAYLAQRQWDVMQLKMKKRIREDQYDLLYPGQGTADVDQWDVTLLVTLITEMFGTSIQQHDIYLLKNEIRGIRNELQHLPNSSNMTDEDFDNYWERLDTAAMTIAKQVFSAEREELFRKKIENAKCNNLPSLGDSLRQWYEEIIKEMQINTKETISILQQVTVQKPGPSGDKHKRIKTADSILAKLQASFETTMTELPDSFNAPSEVVDIRTKLRNNHYVVVTGSYNSRYFETALAAIKGMDYNYKRSVEMHKSSDWRHIDPEDNDFVLCRDPFGNFSYDENKAKAMADIFNSMMHTTQGDENKTLDLVIVTDLTILTECKQYHDHDILEEIVKVFDDTSESRPADLTIECRNQNMTSNYFPVAKNLEVLTSKFLKEYSISSSQENESVIKEAKDMFKAKKAIVLTGPRKCGKTSVAVALASSYQPSQCSLLTKPSDFLKIDFQNICLIIIDEFAGKYCYDEKTVCNWLSMFDHLYNTITAGQMNVIITCEKSKLNRCCTEISSHPVLDHRVDMPARTTVIKQEMVLQNTERDKNKRIKTADGILPKLQASFETTMNELPEDFNAPSEVADIRTKLRNNHYVVVTGSYNSRYFETALAAIKGMGYNYKRSVEMHESSDWRHIDPEDVGFVLCRNPFGSFSYDENKAKAMADIFDNMKHTTKGDENKTLDIVIVTDLTVLTECKKYHDHDILEEIVKVFDDTSESQPADLTLGSGNQNMTSNCSPVANNLGVLTSNFLKQYSISSSQVDESVIKEARDKFKAKKAIVITGPRKCGKTSLAVALASSYQPSQCSLLTEPKDLKKIDLQNICLIIIDEFAGKYCYDERYVYNWFSMFDHLYNAIMAGQINVIITCKKGKLDKCCTEISSHPVLYHRVDMPARTTVIKQEMVLQNTEHTLSVVDSPDRSVNYSAIMETSRTGIAKAFNTHYGNGKPTTILRLPQAGTAQDQYSSPIGIQGSVQNFMTSRNLFPTTWNNILPAQALSTERGDIVDNYAGSTDTGTMVDSSRGGISGAFNMSYRNETEKTILRLPTPDSTQDLTISRMGMPASLLQNFTTVPAQTVSIGVGTGPLFQIHGHQRVTHDQARIPSAQRLTGSHVWSVKDKHKCKIRVKGDRYNCNICGCCLLPSGEILLADDLNGKLKKLDTRYQVISVCDMLISPIDVCYIGNNVAVVTLSNKLQFVDIRGGMTLTKSVDTDHTCHGLAYGNNQLYVIDHSSVYIYSKDGIKQRILYTDQSVYTSFRNIALSDDGSLIYISNWDGGVVTIDSSGNHLNTFTDSEHGGAGGVCVDGEGHVLVSDLSSDKILQLSSDGKKRLGIISHGSDYAYMTRTFCFDKQNAALVAAGYDDNVMVLKLQ